MQHHKTKQKHLILFPNCNDQQQPSWLNYKTILLGSKLQSQNTVSRVRMSIPLLVPNQMIKNQ